MSSAFNLAGWVCFLLAAKNFLGIGASPEDLMTGTLGLLLPIPDVKTLVFAGLAALFGYLARESSKEGPKKGTRVMVCAALCAVLTFTPLSDFFSLVPAALSYQKEQMTADGYEPMPVEDFDLYVFLGSGDSNPSDVDVMEYIMNGYDGHAKDSYDTYKIAGWVYPKEGVTWSEGVVTFCLVDQEGGDILLDGEPAFLRYVSSDPDCYPKHDGGVQTNTVKAKDLSGTPYGFRVESVQRAYYLDVNDGSKHYSPIYN